MIRTWTIGLRGATAILLLLLAASGSSAEDCFTVVVGRNASANGYVMLAHTEDISPQPIVNHYKIPRRKHVAGETLRLLSGAELEQSAETWEYIWSEVPGEEFSDSYLNEWGVCIASLHIHIGETLLVSPGVPSAHQGVTSSPPVPGKWCSNPSEKGGVNQCPSYPCSVL